MPSSERIYKISYDGKEKRGYTYNLPPELDSNTQSEIFKQVLPGESSNAKWAQAVYVGAQIVKAFLAGKELIVVSRLKVSDKQDQVGRQGIREGTYQLLNEEQYVAFLRQLVSDPDLFSKKFGWFRLTQALFLLSTGTRIIITAKYTNKDKWKEVEELALALALIATLRLRKFISVTTLTLQVQEETSIIAVPEQAIEHSKGINVIDVNDILKIK
jgi:hypothetical protein